MGAASVARAATEGVATTAAPRAAGTVIVRVSEAASPLPLGRLAEALRSQLAELRVDVELRSDALASHSTQSGAVVAVVWLERSAEALVVRFYEPAGSSLLERSIPVSGTDAASIEEVALVVRSAVSALLERSASAGTSPLAVPVPTLQTAAPTEALRASDALPTSSAPTSSEQSFELSGAYVVTRYARETDWQQGAAFGVAWRKPLLPLAAGLAYTWLPLLETSTPDLLVTLRRHPFEAFLGFPWQSDGRPFRVEPGVALIADAITRTSSALTSGLEATPPTTLWSWAASAHLRVGARPTPGVWLFAAACADVLLSRYEHVTEGPGGAVSLSPLPVRPRFQLGGAAEF
jgi:hypothetical protein